jgi:hypothetical protein
VPTDEEAGRMRIQLAEESRQRKAEEAAALKASNDEMQRRLASTKAAYLTSAGSATSYFGHPSSRSFTPREIFPRTIPIQSKRSPSQRYRDTYYPKSYCPVKIYEDEEPTLW